MGIFHRKKKEERPWCGCVVAAAGSSTRMGADKLTLPLAGEPVILRTLQALEASPHIQEIVVVTRSESLVEFGTLCRDNNISKVTTVLLGGATRLESVYRGVAQLSSKAKLIAIHDGARPLVSQELIATVVEQAAQTGAAAPALPVKDTVKEVDGLRVTATLDRDQLRCVQTPQVFDADLLRAALHQAVTEGWEVTDDCSMVERLGATVTLVPGDERNIKLTTPLDIVVGNAVWEVL